MSKLAGRIAVVTGGSAGIGLGIATHFVREGARVFITGRNQTGLDKAVAEIGAPLAPSGATPRTSPTSTTSTKRSGEKPAASTCSSSTPGSTK